MAPALRPIKDIISVFGGAVGAHSLREIARTLAQLGHVASSGKPFDAKSIARMVEGKQP